MHPPIIICQKWSLGTGVQFLHLPTYSHDLNPTELCFRKVNILLKTEKYGKHLSQNVKVALYSAFDEITIQDTLSFLEELCI